MPCVGTASAAKTPLLPCVATAVALCFHCRFLLFKYKTLPLPCVSTLPLRSWLRHCLCLVSPPPLRSWLRYCVALRTFRGQAARQVQPHPAAATRGRGQHQGVRPQRRGVPSSKKFRMPVCTHTHGSARQRSVHFSLPPPTRLSSILPSSLALFVLLNDCVVPRPSD